MADRLRGPFPGLCTAVTPTTPAPEPEYTVEVYIGDAPAKRFTKVRPQGWLWKSLNIDEDGAKMVGRVVECYFMGDRAIFNFIPPPHVGPC